MNQDLQTPLPCLQPFTVEALFLFIEKIFTQPATFEVPDTVLHILQK